MKTSSSQTFKPILPAKKNNAKELREYRLISLKSHALKMFLKIIQKVIYTECEFAIEKSQFGLKKKVWVHECVTLHSNVNSKLSG